MAKQKQPLSVVIVFGDNNEVYRVYPVPEGYTAISINHYITDQKNWLPKANGRMTEALWEKLDQILENEFGIKPLSYERCF